MERTPGRSRIRNRGPCESRRPDPSRRRSLHRASWAGWPLSGQRRPRRPLVAQKTCDCKRSSANTVSLLCVPRFAQRLAYTPQTFAEHIGVHAHADAKMVRHTEELPWHGRGVVVEPQILEKLAGIAV